MNNLYATDTVDKQRKEMDRKLANHYNASNCDLMERPLVEYPEYYENSEGVIMELVEVIKNTSKSCPKKHNSDTAVYKLFKGALGYDNLRL